MIIRLQMDNIASTLFQISGTAVIIFVSLYGTLWGIGKYNKFKTNKTKNNNYQNNIISIIHNIQKRGLSSIATESGDNMITLRTHMDFIRSYENMDKSKDIHVIIHTPGGSLSSCEAICNCIDNHRKLNNGSKVIAYVPYYAYSGGCMIALSCDKIVMLTNAILGPCDGQSSTGYTQYSVASIIEAVKYKMDNKEKISEQWLATHFDANLCKERQKAFLAKRVEDGLYEESVGEAIYDELFSGKHNHDKIFSANESLKLGLMVDIVDSLPTDIKEIVQTKILDDID